MIPAPKPPRSRAEILADPALTPYQRGQEIDALIKWEREHPPVAEVVTLTPENLRQLQRHQDQLVNIKGNVLRLDEMEKNYSTARPGLERKIVDLKENIAKDALAVSRESLVDFRAESERLAFVDLFLNNFRYERIGIGRDVIAIFHQVNGILEKLDTNHQKFFLSGVLSGNSMDEAIAAIEQILEKK